MGAMGDGGFVRDLKRAKSSELRRAPDEEPQCTETIQLCPKPSKQSPRSLPLSAQLR